MQFSSINNSIRLKRNNRKMCDNILMCPICKKIICDLKFNEIDHVLREKFVQCPYCWFIYENPYCKIQIC